MSDVQNDGKAPDNTGNLVLISDYTGSGYPNHDWDIEQGTKVRLGDLDTSQLHHMIESLTYDIGDVIAHKLKKTPQAKALAECRLETRDFIGDIMERYPQWAGPHQSAQGGHLMLELKTLAAQSGRTPQEEADRVTRNWHIPTFAPRMTELLEAAYPQLNEEHKEEIVRALNHTFKRPQELLYMGDGIELILDDPKITRDDLEDRRKFYFKLRELENMNPPGHNTFDKLWKKMESADAGLSETNPLILEKNKAPLKSETVIQQDVERGAQLTANEEEARNRLYRKFVEVVHGTPGAKTLAEKVATLEAIADKKMYPREYYKDREANSTLRNTYNRLTERIRVTGHTTINSMVGDLTDELEHKRNRREMLTGGDDPDLMGAKDAKKPWREIVFQNREDRSRN